MLQRQGERATRTPWGARIGNRIGGLLGMLLAVAAAGALARQPMMPPGAGSAVMRAQSHAVSRAIGKNLDTLIRPRLRISQGGTGPVTGLALSENEQRLVTAVGDRSLRVWDLSIGREVLRLRGLGAELASLALSPDGGYIFAMDEKGGARLWDVKAPGKPLALPKDFPRQPVPAQFTAAAGRLYLEIGRAHV
jgi:hypothetical protein